MPFIPLAPHPLSLWILHLSGNINYSKFLELPSGRTLAILPRPNLPNYGYNETRKCPIRREIERRKQSILIFGRRSISKRIKFSSFRCAGSLSASLIKFELFMSCDRRVEWKYAFDTSECKTGLASFLKIHNFKSPMSQHLLQEPRKEGNCSLSLCFAQLQFCFSMQTPMSGMLNDQKD